MTIKIVSTDPASQGPFVIIDRANFNPDVHELYGDQDLGAPTERVPTMAELLAAHDQLLERERALDEREQRLAEAKERIEAQGVTNEVEALRLRDEAARMQVANDTATATTATAPPPAATAASTEKPGKAAKA